MRRPSSSPASSSPASSSSEPLLNYSRAGYAILASDLPPGTRLLAFALVHRCDKWTAGTTAAKREASHLWFRQKCGMSLNTVLRHLKILRERGYIRSEAAFASDGRRMANVYFLEMSKFGTPSLVRNATPEASKQHARRRELEASPASAAASRELLAKLAASG